MMAKIYLNQFGFILFIFCVIFIMEVASSRSHHSNHLEGCINFNDVESLEFEKWQND